MEIIIEPINGICFGVEYVPADDSEDDDEGEPRTLLIDLILVRLIIQW